MTESQFEYLKLMASKYKSIADDLEKAYQETQKRGTQSDQQVASLRKELKEVMQGGR